MELGDIVPGRRNRPGRLIHRLTILVRPPCLERGVGAAAAGLHHGVDHVTGTELAGLIAEALIGPQRTPHFHVGNLDWSAGGGSAGRTLGGSVVLLPACRRRNQQGDTARPHHGTRLVPGHDPRLLIPGAGLTPARGGSDPGSESCRDWPRRSDATWRRPRTRAWRSWRDCRRRPRYRCG